jgi:DUF1680 family protein
MPCERVYAHPSVRMDAGRVALRRGPLLYCLEQVDNPAGRVTGMRLPRAAKIKAVERKDLFDGIVALSAKDKSAKIGDWDGDLYCTTPPKFTNATLTAIPYYLWSNRAKGPMQVWIVED